MSIFVGDCVVNSYGGLEEIWEGELFELSKILLKLLPS